MQDLFEAGSMAEASREAEAERNAMLAIGQADQARTSDDDTLSTIGMIGEEPEADMAAARTALAAGDLDATLKASDDAYRAWNGAWQEGRRRALLGVAVLATIIVLGSAIGSRVRRSLRSRLRPPATAAMLAVMLATGGAVVPPAASPSLPFLAGLATPVVAAVDDLDITTAARYVVDPGDAVVHVTLDVTAVNRKPTRTAGGTITRYFFDGVNLGVQPEATRFRATQDGAAIKVTTAAGDGYRLVTVLFRKNIYLKETAKVRLTFDLPAGKPRSESDVRVGAAFATFLVWAFGDQGTVTVQVPKGFVVDVSGDEMAEAAGSGDSQVFTARTSAPVAWFAWINARNDEGLTRQQVLLEGGDRIVIRGWPEDPSWRDRVATVLADAVPEMVVRTGLPWPVDGALSVTEVHTPLLEGYAGFYDTDTDEITISEDLDDATIIHEVSHAWFNSGLFTQRWINEGLAEEYASRVLETLDGDPSAPSAVNRASPEAFALNDWPPPAPIGDEQSEAREQYGYDASWMVIRSILAEAGEDGFQVVFRAANERTTAYVGDGAPERSALPNDWRRFLDLVEELGGADGATDLVATWAVTGDAPAQLAERDAARMAYDELLEDGDGWAAPTVVRLAMDADAGGPSGGPGGRCGGRDHDRSAPSSGGRGASGTAPGGPLGRSVSYGPPCSTGTGTAARRRRLTATTTHSRTAVPPAVPPTTSTFVRPFPGASAIVAIARSASAVAASRSPACQASLAAASSPSGSSPSSPRDVSQSLGAPTTRPAATTSSRDVAASPARDSAASRSA